MAHTLKGFNLVDDAWIPTSRKGLVSLSGVFSGGAGEGLGGNPMQKVAVSKLLLAIAQAASTPEDNAEWVQLGSKGLADACQEYVKKWHDAFDLYGEKPFMQMPAIAKAEQNSFGTFLPHVATGNTTLLQNSQREAFLSPSEKALLLVALCGYGIGGKKGDNRIILTPNYAEKTNPKGKPATGKPGPWLGFLGFLHHQLEGSTLLESLWFNLLTHEDIGQLPLPVGLGIPPWEKMPEGEDCPAARELKGSLMGCLTPLSKFALLSEDTIQVTDGIKYPGHLEGYFDPSIGIKRGSKKVEVLWVNPAKLPWRTLPALLSFVGGERGIDCAGLRCCLWRAQDVSSRIGIWAGGLRVSSNAGEQYASGEDDFVDSLQFLSADALNSRWFAALQDMMGYLDDISRSVYGAVMGYFTELKVDGKAFAEGATAIFWELCNHNAQQIFDQCADDEAAPLLKQTIKKYARQAFSDTCPNTTARQLAAWGKVYPFVGTLKRK